MIKPIKLPPLPMHFDGFMDEGTKKAVQDYARAAIESAICIGGGQEMICITDMDNKKHYLHRDAIARVVEAGPNWHRISAYVKLFNGGTIEACESAEEIRDQIERQSTMVTR